MFAMQHPRWRGNVPVLENESRTGMRHLEYVISHCLPRSRENEHRLALSHGVQDKRALRGSESLRDVQYIHSIRLGIQMKFCRRKWMMVK